MYMLLFHFTQFSSNQFLFNFNFWKWTPSPTVCFPVIFIKSIPNTVEISEFHCHGFCAKIPSNWFLILWKFRNFTATVFSQKFRQINVLLKNFTINWFDGRKFAWQRISRFSTRCVPHWIVVQIRLWKLMLTFFERISWKQRFS